MTDNEVVHVVVYDPDLATEATLCIKSIHEFVEGADVTAFVPAKKAHRLSEGEYEWLNERATVLSGETRVDELGPLTKPVALQAAGDECPHDYLLFLDSDTVILEPITVHHRSDADVFAAPVGDSLQFWAREESLPKWKELYDNFGMEMPDYTIECRDGARIHPYYNSGVILTKNNELPVQYRQVAEAVHDAMPEGVGYFAEQVAFALVANQYDVELLPERSHTGLIADFFVHPSPKVIHYMDLRCLFRVPNPSVRRKLERIGVKDHLPADKNPYVEAAKTLRFPVWKHINRLVGKHVVDPRR